MTNDSYPTKVVIEKPFLYGSGFPDLLQRFATVYISSIEHRVLAPPNATGNPAEWLDHSAVRQPSLDSFGSETDVTGTPLATLVKKLVLEELLKGKDEHPEDQSTDSSASYYHVRLTPSTSTVPDPEVKFDLQFKELNDRILEPYRNSRPIVIGGRTIPIQDLARIEIFKSTRPSTEFNEWAPQLARSGARDWSYGETDVKVVTDQFITTPSIPSLPQSSDAIELLCSRFHAVTVQLRSRHGDRATLDVSDEYDVQDLLHSLLRIFFDDVRAEEWTPSYAGKSSRMDFLLPTDESVVETKKTRQGLGAKEVGSQLIEDIARYTVHPRCKRLVCFVYDPEGRVNNPRGIETDLSGNREGLEVKVIIVPKL